MLTELTKDIQNWDLNKVGKTRLIEMLLQPTYKEDIINRVRNDWLTLCDVKNKLEYLTRSELITLILLNKSIRKHKRNPREKTCELYEFFLNGIHFVYKTYLIVSGYI